MIARMRPVAPKEQATTTAQTARKAATRPRRSRITTTPALFSLILVLLLVTPTWAAFVNFQNCLPSNLIHADPPPLHLQLVPYNVSATFNVSDPNHALNITIYGNVAGQANEGVLPEPGNHSHWDNATQTFGKIVDEDPKAHLNSTLFAKLNVLNYEAFASMGQSFCRSLDKNSACPLGPVFDPITPENSTSLPAVSYSHPMESSYGFTTISAIITAVQGDKQESSLLCVSFDITPYIGQVAEDLLTYLPLMILILVAIATASAAIFSPWGTWDVFRATSNYGREVRLLRMMTPGFGDCLNYLQFIVLTGSLSLNYPGFFQPAVSSVAWSALMFNQSFVTHGPGRPSTIDGIYVANGTYGLDTMSQLVGMTDDQDLWTGMMVWLLTAIGGIVLLIQLAFGLRLLFRIVSKTQQEDLRAKDGPFSAGNTIRIVFNYFMVPITAFSMFQLVIAGGAPTPAIVAMAVLTLLILLGFTGWLIWVIIDARPRSFLFDDLPTVLLYGPLYNTYSDSAAPFAVVTIIINFMRGIAIGAVQPSGIAQIVLLAICEVIFLLTLNAFRPFFNGTFMNLINTLFSAARLIIILLMVVFVPSLDINDASKGYVGYIILILHGLVLFAGFFIRVLSTLFELTARAAGAGEDSSAIGGFARVLGLRQLARRDPRDAARSRNSYASNATMLNHTGVEKAMPSGQRSRSASASSGQLLNNGGGPRQSVTLESVSAFGGPSQSGSNIPPSITGAAASSISHGRGSAAAGVAAGAATFAGLRSMEPADPYFRTPRPRRVTTTEMPEAESGDTRSRHSWGSGDWTKAAGHAHTESGNLGEGPSVSGRGTPLPLPVGVGSTRERTDSLDDRLPKPDYATREVDYYYGVRGPALSHMGTRRLKTGPADPTGTVSSAAGWFKGIFGGKTKEKGKGFEVVRSSRMPPGMEMEEKDPAVAGGEPYADEPGTGAESSKRRLELDDEGDAVGGGTRHLPDETGRSGSGAYAPLDGEGFPQLPTIDAGAPLPSRWASRASTAKPTREDSQVRRNEAPPVPQLPQEIELGPVLDFQSDMDLEPVPDLPRKSSRRTSSTPGSTENLPRMGAPHQRGSNTNLPAGGTYLSAASSGSGSNLALPAILGSSNHATANNAGNNHLPAQRLPFANTLSPNTLSPAARHNRTLSGGSDVSAVSNVSRTSDVSALTVEHDGTQQAVYGPNVNTAGFRVREVRPSSVGYVQQHRASDGIRVASGAGASLKGSSAELVEEDGRR